MLRILKDIVHSGIGNFFLVKSGQIEDWIYVTKYAVRPIALCRLSGNRPCPRIQVQ